MVRAESITSTLVYTYNAAGLRVAQSVESSQSVFSWDWASGLPEMLSDGASVYLVGHELLCGLGQADRLRPDAGEGDASLTDSCAIYFHHGDGGDDR